MFSRRYKASRYRRKVKKGLLEVDQSEQQAFTRWLASSRLSANSQQVDLPSSQITTAKSIIMTDKTQLIVFIDTCSIIKYRTEFMSHVTDLKEQFILNTCPIRFMISLPVLEELDKCNRPRKRKRNSDHQDTAEREQQAGCSTCVKQEKEPTDMITHNTSNNTSSLLNASSNRDAHSDPPRSFMRFIEEELRSGEILITEFDPSKKQKLGGQFEIVNQDDRILDSFRRSNQVLQETPHNKDSKLILVTEDNNFKCKATAFEIVSYRWLEYRAKFKNFLQDHYTTTPQVIRPNIQEWKERTNQMRGEEGTSAKVVDYFDSNKLSQQAALAVSRLKAALDLDRKDVSNGATDGDIKILREIINVD